MARLHLTLLGGLSATLDDHPVTFPTRKSAALLAFLAVEGSRKRTRARLADLLWSRSGEDQARQSLRQAMFNVRKALDDLDPFNIDDDTISIRHDLITSDIEELEHLASSGASSARLNELLQGEFLEGFELDEPPFDQWVANRRTELREIAIRAYLSVLDEQMKSGDVAGAIGSALHLLELEPLNEDAHRKLMVLYQRQGRINAAIRQYHAIADALRQQMRSDPQPETTTLYEQITRGRSGLADGDRPDLQPGGSRILIVEDNQLQRRLVSEILEDAGYEVIEVDNGAEALLEIGRRRCDLILLDINLPVVDGINILEAVKHQKIDVPIIVVSAEPPEKLEAKALELGATDFIRKPVEKKTLLLRVRRGLGNDER